MRLIPSHSTRSTASWIWQALTGVLLVPLLSIHIIAQHFAVPGGARNLAQVNSYLSNPAILAIEVLFLVAVTTHAMLGVRSILIDMGLPQRLRTATSYGLTAVGALTVAYGGWLTVSVAR